MVMIGKIISMMRVIWERYQNDANDDYNMIIVTVITNISYML